MSCRVEWSGVLIQTTTWRMCCGALRFISTIFSSSCHIYLSDTNETFCPVELFKRKKNVLQTWRAKNISNVSQAFCSASRSGSSSSRSVMCQSLHSSPELVFPQHERQTRVADSFLFFCVSLFASCGSGEESDVVRHNTGCTTSKQETDSGVKFQRFESWSEKNACGNRLRLKVCVDHIY